ncbi:2,3-bisphosphoglycerate-dependent phosphoglycerate mutase [Candidatus Saccharibacteria bacterium]|nr:2,3-bisphosphoglycerate-dependent phosphoglycerate mutase [Candidatus Saccharibacteria bacterium]
MSGKLILIRHGESEWNALGKWTGWTDVSITEEGARLSRELGEKLRDTPIDIAYDSELKRTKETLDAVLEGAGKTDVERHESGAINERDYGVYTGMLKEEVKAEIGDEAYLALRRGWDRPIENGESLKDVYSRALPFYLQTIVPELRAGKNILIVGHGNSLRALLKYIENISDEDISSTEFGHNCAIVYTVNEDGRQDTKDVVEL